MLSHVFLAILTFAVTNIDDLLILSLYFSSRAYRVRNIIAGQYLGIIALITVSFVGFILGVFLEKHWISLLGVVPLGLGVRGIIGLFRGEREDDSLSTKSHSQAVSVALVTIANGGDNIGVYTPLFATLDLVHSALYVFIFLVLTGMWCAFAWYLTNHPLVRDVLSKYGRVVLPVFLITLGFFILKDFVVWLNL